MINPTNTVSVKTAKTEWNSLTDHQIEDLVDKGLRHKVGVKDRDYLKQFLSISRQFGYATHDDSWGEFEKEFAIIIRRLVKAERAAMVKPEVSGWMPIETAPRDGTWVLVWNGNTVQQVVYSDEHKGWFNSYGLYEDPWEGNAIDATYWQPLPPAPIAAQGEE